MFALHCLAAQMFEEIRFLSFLRIEMSKRKLEAGCVQQKILSFFLGQQTRTENYDSVGDDTKALDVKMASTSASDNISKAKTPSRTYDKPFVHDWLSRTNPQYSSWLTYDNEN